MLPPFSARNLGAHAQVDNDCPETTRIGLLHLLRRLVDRGYAEGWNSVVGELQRIARVRPDNSHYESDAEPLLLALPWEKVFDFCERLYSYLAQDASRYNGQTEEWELIKPRSEVQEYVATELQRLFLEEHLAFEFSGGLVRRRGRRHTADQVSRSEGSAAREGPSAFHQGTQILPKCVRSRS